MLRIECALHTLGCTQKKTVIILLPSHLFRLIKSIDFGWGAHSQYIMDPIVSVYTAVLAIRIEASFISRSIVPEARVSPTGPGMRG